MSDGFKVTAPIKLVIWDMDDTFWSGTLSEGNITLIDQNIEIVKTLTDRGVMSSISSKNDFDVVKQVLLDAEIWDYFIFPQISWNSKGGSISRIIEQASLRPDNVLFIDDNSMNIEEVRFLFPTIMAAYPQDVLPDLLDLEHAKGKDDRTHSRLKQYKQLEKKVAEQALTSLSNEDFLRQCEIKIRFEFDVEQHIVRIIELINRSNQLNFTKVRLETDQAIAEFKENLKRHDVISAAIFASDRYGNHGLIGFYMQLKNERINKLLHYVWSCRMMNSGLEQYVYEHLGEPTIQVVEPVSNPIKVFESIDWVNECVSGEDVDNLLESPRLLLIGSCDLTAVASYCSRNRKEYVNGVKNAVMTRCDDFGFILNDSEKVEASTALDEIPCWDKVDFASFQDSLTTSDVLIVSLSAAMKGTHLLTDDGIVVRVHPESLGDYIDVHPWARFLKRCKFYAHSIEQKNQLLKRSLDFIDISAGNSKYKFLLGANTRNVGGILSQANYDLLTNYNLVCEKFCQENANWHFVSINDVIDYEKLIDDRHYTRIGYLDIANYINSKITNTDILAESKSIRVTTTTTFDESFVDLIRSGRECSRFNLFGNQFDPKQQGGWYPLIKRIIKLTPLRRIMSKPNRDPLIA